MKHLQLSPPLLLLVMGLPGSGKTFFARQFSDQYGLAYVSEDRIRYELFEQPQFAQDENEIISRMRDYGIEQLMRTERGIVVEGDFLNAKERINLVKFAAVNGYRSLIVWIQADQQTAQTRAGKRDRRNQDSKFAAEVNSEVFTGMKSRLQRPGEKELALVISGKHAFKSQSLTVLRKITSLYSESIGQRPAAPVSPPVIAARPNRPLPRRIIQ